MINITRKEDCVGCNACVQRCPKQCISMNEDEQGFIYPKVDVSKCIECGLCEKVCPVINQSDPKTPYKVYAGWNTNDKIRLTSSSGGIFYALAKKIIDEGGVVFGAKFNDKWEVVHCHAETTNDIKAFQTSKYVQSSIGDTYLLTEKYLKQRRKVLYSGTSCQIAGLKRFLKKEYENLFTVDVICHGVPSPLIWRNYITLLRNQINQIQSHYNIDNNHALSNTIHISKIAFRDKKLGWEKFGFSVQTSTTYNSNEELKCELNKNTVEEVLLNEIHTKNLYMQIFLKNLDLRPSCYMCPSKLGKSSSDISLADFWKISSMYPELYDFNGVSLILANTEKGKTFLTNLKNEIYLSEVEYLHALKANPAIVKSAIKPKEYASFWKEYQINGFRNIKQILDKMRPSLIQKVIDRSIKLVRNILGDKKYNLLKRIIKKYI